MKDPYECPRCGYQTLHKASMRKHFYEKKKACPTLKSMTELTDDIKSHIMSYRKYIFEEQQDTTRHTVNQTIHNYNTVYNYIAGMDVIEKLTKFLDYKQINLLDFEESIEERFSAKARRLVENKNTKYSFALDQNDILQLIDNISKITSDDDFEYLNIIYDNKHDRFKIYEEGDWKEWLRVMGVHKIINYLKEYYLDTYEVYLIRRHRDTDISMQERSQSLELLMKYYKFIGVFDIEPYVKGKSNNKILCNTNNPQHCADYDNFLVEHYTLEDEYYPMYVRTRDNITKSEINEIKKTTIDILKRNSNKSLEQLNKKVTELFNMDEQFKCLIINNPKIP